MTNKRELGINLGFLKLMNQWGKNVLNSFDTGSSFTLGAQSTGERLEFGETEPRYFSGEN